MKEGNPEKRIRWKRVITPEGATVYVRPIDPNIQKQMPPAGSKPFIQVGIFEYAVRELKRTLHIK